MKRKALIYTGILIITSFIINFINSQIEKSKLKNLTYNQAKIYNYTLVSKNSEKIIVKGKLLIDKITYMEGKNINTTIIEKESKIYITAKNGKYDKKEVINMKDDVKISTKGLQLITPYITYNIKKGIAYNNTTNKIFTKNMETTGKNIFINIKKEKILLKKVKTKIYEGIDG